MSRSSIRRVAVLAVAALSVATPVAAQAQDGDAQQQALQPLAPQAFVTEAAQSNQFEIQSSRLVRTSSPDPDVRAIARHLIRDHTDQARKLATVAGQLGLQVPSGVNSAQRAILNRIRSAARGSASRDRRYLSAQVTAHEQAIILHERVALTVGTPPPLHQGAVLALPILGMHLGEVEMARSDD